MQRKTTYLTFVIICYEQDFQNALKNIYSIIESRIPFKYEILAVFNRQYESPQIEKYFFNQLENLKNVTPLLVTGAKNQYYCRYQAIKSINSKYTWFIDGDDEVLKIPRKFRKLDYDIVSFNAKTSDDFEWCFGPSRMIKEKHREYIEKTINFTLWNKWIKTDILKQYVASNEKIVSGEDSLYCIFSILKANSIKYFEDILYSYSKNLQKETPNCSNFLRFKYLLTGNNLLLSELIQNIEVEELKKLGYDCLENNELSWYLRAAEKFSLEELKECSKYLNENFLENKIQDAFESLPINFSHIIKRLSYNGVDFEH